ncbi:Sphingomyelin phosphodiesterase 2, neutral membrane (Neutral sphingomyelinase) [Homalodisca vitripennis]|nr:Sphingomyelin phosphodiesterase 2, neutral membrane (Neutral sphingomyelinase) [Homalodisca vitripennis]
MGYLPRGSYLFATVRAPQLERTTVCATTGYLIPSKFPCPCFQVGGIVGISKDRADRMAAIADVLSSGKFDIVCLQELWSQDDYNNIVLRVQKVLPFTHYFFSGVTGSGLSILSRYPFESFIFHQWSVNGYIHKIFHGDWFGGKGVGLCRVTVQGLNINIYTTHLHAQYNDDDEYLAHRVVQAFDTAQFVDLTSGAAHLSILAGDLNTQPGELCHRLVQHTAHLRDAYEKNSEGSDIGTYDCSRNSYANSREVSRNPNGVRIDHIFYRPGLGAQVELQNYTMPLAERVPGESFSYSDHEAIAATFKIIPSIHHNMADHMFSKPEEMMTCLCEGTGVISEAVKQLYWSRVHYWSMISTIIFGLACLCLFSDIPETYSRAFQLSLVILTAVIIFAFIMATVWNKIEQNALRSTMMAMQFMATRVNGSSPETNSSIVSGVLI